MQEVLYVVLLLHISKSVLFDCDKRKHINHV